ncbi:hypothetical protein RhiirC2_801691 [Rhizophagus irregularis]|uniref:Uncharacterized protein n=1 Tax=Rhizophagus irregularis TaxID=588596 RepID=A0A2N1M277_9GLOM|nr:hypothetical protein RhiirC2_801691 [Rhizophagus irregularis]
MNKTGQENLNETNPNSFINDETDPNSPIDDETNLNPYETDESNGPDEPSASLELTSGLIFAGWEDFKS